MRSLALLGCALLLIINLLFSAQRVVVAEMVTSET